MLSEKSAQCMKGLMGLFNSVRCSGGALEATGEERTEVFQLCHDGKFVSPKIALDVGVDVASVVRITYQDFCFCSVDLQPNRL